MSLAAGTRLGPYEVIAPIGKGGMGEVYRARDTKLERDVAIKVLPDEFAKDKERLARFEREAKLLASLNHPNIASIYGFEESGDLRALVLELVEGPTLAERIQDGRIPVDEAVAIARQIAEALEAGHEAGVIHRDLKPANVKLKDDATVKVLDYGLAKALEGEAPAGTNSPLSQSPTLIRHGTQIGVILGTAAYMSPEQASGKRVDKRADVWAFGVVLFEMLAGKPLYAGETVSEILASVIKEEPNLARLPTETPNYVRSLVHRCLTKDPNQRLRDIGEARIAIYESEVELETETPPRRGRTSLWVAAVAASLVVGVTIGGVVRTPSESPRVPARFVVTPPASESLRLMFDHGDLAITPDGSRIVYGVTADGRNQLVVQAIGQLEATPLDGLGNDVGGPFLSPDGNWIGYFAYGNVLRKVSIHGGPPVTLGKHPGWARGASWSEDDTIVFATAEPNGLWRIPSVGGTPEELIELPPDHGEYLWPEVLPGGDALLLTIQTGSIENAQIAVLSLSTGEVKVVASGGSNPHYVPTGHIVFGVSGALWAVGFDLERLEAKSEPVRVLDGVVTKPRGAADFSVARDGSLVYVEGPPFDTERTLVWVDRQGREEALNAPPRYYFNTRLSPDGSRLALDVRDQESDIWIWEFARETLTRLTFDSGPDVYPIWSPDGLRVAFSSGSPRNLFWKVADGTGGVEKLPESENPQFAHTFSPDGKRLVMREFHPERGSDLVMLSFDEGGPSEALVATEFNE